jgi:hypothetical protein
MHSHGLRLLALFAFGVLGGAMPAGAQLATDMKLEDAGFVMRRADTPDKIARLRLIPPRQFVTRTGKSGRYYLWADADYCKCVFVGDGRALQSFKDMRAKLPQPDNVGPGGGGINPENLIIHDMDLDAGIGVPDGDVLDYHME